MTGRSTAACFPSKNDLILAYLNLRHEPWMHWFTEALQRHGGALKGAQALTPALKEWLSSQALGAFRGCAFLNGVSEMGPAIPAVVETTRQHKPATTPHSPCERCSSLPTS